MKFTTGDVMDNHLVYRCPICGDLYGDVCELEEHVDECACDDIASSAFQAQRRKNIKRYQMINRMNTKARANG